MIQLLRKEQTLAIREIESQVVFHSLSLNNMMGLSNEIKDRAMLAVLSKIFALGTNKETAV